MESFVKRYFRPIWFFLGFVYGVSVSFVVLTFGSPYGETLLDLLHFGVVLSLLPAVLLLFFYVQRELFRELSGFYA